MKSLKARPIIGDIAAQRLWGKGTAAQRAADVLEGTFAQQRAFIEDPAKLKWALCTRRAAKSYSDGLALAKAALERPDVSCLYIGLTRESAKRIMWKDVLKDINRRHKLAIRFNESELSARFPNGSVIDLVGADSNEDERQKLLGQKFVLVVIDEPQAFGITFASSCTACSSPRSRLPRNHHPDGDARDPDQGALLTTSGEKRTLGE